MKGCRVMVCPGYEGYECGKKFKQKCPRQKRCLGCIPYHNLIRGNTSRYNRRKNNPEVRKRDLQNARKWMRKTIRRMGKKAFRSRRNAYGRQYYKNLKDEVYAAYGGYKCNCSGCVVTEPLFLTLDHVKDDGQKAIKQHGSERGRKMWTWIKKHNFPKGMFQVMCFNCNCGRARNRGACPHLKENSNA
jgi:hypothetical protein